MVVHRRVLARRPAAAERIVVRELNAKGELKLGLYYTERQGLG